MVERVLDIMADLSVRRTLVYVEGDASMSQYQDAEGKPRSSLNLVQRKLPFPCKPSKTQLLMTLQKNSKSFPQRSHNSRGTFPSTTHEPIEYTSLSLCQ